MPKEFIFDRVSPYIEGKNKTPLVEVSWQRDLEDVQIVGYARNPETLETIGREEAQFVTLDRYGINQMIRVLRRARDQAFGRDE